MHRVTLTILCALFMAACGAATESPQPTPAPQSPSPTSPASPTPNPTDDEAAGFYLRAYYSQALPSDSTFTWLPPLTIVDGLLIDGNVAVPAIYPGPLMITPFAREISDAGVAAVLDEARRLGLLEDQTDFSGGESMPGQRLGMLELAADGQQRVLTGQPDLAVPCDGVTCSAEPGSPEAFAAFWQSLLNFQAWLEPELGPAVQYEPERVALLLTPPQPAEPGLAQRPVEWPLDTPLAEAGVAFAGGEGLRCMTVAGEELEALMPVLRGGNQLTVFVDETDDARLAQVRVLVPGETSPCAD